MTEELIIKSFNELKEQIELSRLRKLEIENEIWDLHEALNIEYDKDLYAIVYRADFGNYEEWSELMSKMLRDENR